MRFHTPAGEGAAAFLANLLELPPSNPHMRNSALCLIFLAMPLAAQFVDNQKPEMQCEDHEGGHQQRTCRVQEQRMGSTGSLQIDAGANGGVTVRGWSGTDMLVRAKVEGWDSSMAEAQSVSSAVILHANSGIVGASGPEMHGKSGWSVSYEVFVPHMTNVTAHASNGGMHISDVGGTLDVHTVNGGLHLTRLTGDVRGETVNGGVHVELMGDHWDGRGMDVSSTNGGVHVTVPQQYSARLESSTVNGGVVSDLPNVMAQGTRGRQESLVATLGAGGPTLHITTVNGGVSIDHAGAGNDE